MCGRRDESLLLDDLVHAAMRLTTVVSQRGATRLGTDPNVDEVVLWNLTILGEAAKRLSAETRLRFRGIPWSRMARMRDVVVHHYEGVDWPQVARTCTVDLPALLPRLREVREVLRREAETTTST